MQRLSDHVIAIFAFEMMIATIIERAWTARGYIDEIDSDRRGHAVQCMDVTSHSRPHDSPALRSQLFKNCQSPA